MGLEDSDYAERVAARSANERRVEKVFGSWASAIGALFVMAPSVYRLVSGPEQWYDVVSVVVGIGLVSFHAVRLVRLRRSAAQVPARRADSSAHPG
ncbi:hypothetical protein [Pseudarthrobacter sp. C4D7]|uniref:hypothetical protein n=1 Tax=Pseudarthrobacter sp. C4D7 TaxID=2735268 RepID=UPI0015853D9A|nr:hypothetical protein [Pseudarthrobacter sp. C4D7]NUT71260.1 hypothetical protein [Pseudarthrobacter sp. C4D7]